MFGAVSCRLLHKGFEYRLLLSTPPPQQKIGEMKKIYGCLHDNFLLLCVLRSYFMARHFLHGFNAGSITIFFTSGSCAASETRGIAERDRGRQDRSSKGCDDPAGKGMMCQRLCCTFRTHSAPPPESFAVGKNNISLEVPPPTPLSFPIPGCSPGGGVVGDRHLVNPKFFVAAHCVVMWVTVLWGTATCIPCTHGRTFCSLPLKWNLTAQPRHFTPSRSRSRSPYIGSPLNTSYAEMLSFYAAISVPANVRVRWWCGPPGGVGGPSLGNRPPGGGGGPSSLGWGTTRGGGGVSLFMILFIPKVCPVIAEMYAHCGRCRTWGGGRRMRRYGQKEQGKTDGSLSSELLGLAGPTTLITVGASLQMSQDVLRVQ